MTISSHDGAARGDSLQEQLFAILSEQVSLARRGKLDEAVLLVEQSDRLLAQADGKQLEKIWTAGPIKGLYDELRLIIDVAKREVADELKGIRKGTNVLRAYKGISCR
jgi:hypothetical protein